MDLSLVVLISFVAIVVGCVAILLVFRDLFLAGGGTTSVSVGLAGSRRIRRAANVFDEAPAKNITGRIDQSFDRLVLETGIEWTPMAAFLLLIACGLAAGGALFFYWDNPIAGVVGAVVGLGLPLIFMQVRRVRRAREILDQLPYTLELMARAVRAGESFDQALTLVGEEATGPLGAELKRSAQQLQMGMSVSSAMQHLSRRIRLSEIRILATTLMVHRQTGGNLPETLERMSGVVRDRMNYRRQMRAATGAGRASTLLIASISPVVYLVMFLWQPQHVQILLDEPLGRVMLLMALVLEIVGVVWVTQLLKTDR